MIQKRPRIALISGGIGFGGSTTFLLNLGGELVRRELPALVVSLEWDNPYANDFRLRRIPLHVEDDRTRIFEDRLESALTKLREFQPTAVVASMGSSSFEILRYLPRGISKLGMIHSDFPENYPPFVPYVPLLDGMVAVSRQIESNLRTHPQFGTIPTYYVPCGIEVPASDSEFDPHHVKTNKPLRILYLGRLSRPQKRVHLFPRILRQLCSSQIPFAWTIAGDGPEAAWLRENLHSEAGVQVRLLGSVPYGDVPAILKEHDIFLLASDAEGLPLGLLEAMAHGVIPVVSNLPSGVREVATDECAMLVDPANVSGYGEAIIWLAQHREKMPAMAARGAAVVRANYSVKAMADRWFQVLEKIEHSMVAPWSEKFDVRAPLSDPRRLWFSPVARSLRRWMRARGVQGPSTQA